jgi:hypothetical protein
VGWLTHRGAEAAAAAQEAHRRVGVDSLMHRVQSLQQPCRDQQAGICLEAMGCRDAAAWQQQLKRSHQGA